MGILIGKMLLLWSLLSFMSTKHSKTLGSYKAGTPEGYKKICAHLVYDCKHDGRHKGRMVVDGHLTDVPVNSIYSGVDST
jgi:hypothetical protein